VAAQTFSNFESIVVDDGSSAATCAQYATLWRSLDERFILERAETCGQPGTGPGAARNRGIRRARGEFVAFCDDDDRWRVSNHLDVAVRTMTETGADLYLANMCGEDSGVMTIPDWFPDSPDLTSGPQVHEGPAVHVLRLRHLLSLLRRYVPHPNGWIVRRSLLEATGGFWEPMRHGEDLELLFRLGDKARRTLYRPDAVVAFNVTPQERHFTRISPIERAQLAIAAALHVCGEVDNPEVRHSARALAAWQFRCLSRNLRAAGRPRPAGRMAWMGLCLQPTFGALRDVALAATAAGIDIVAGRRPPP
jgi:hypothetical protein